MCFDDTLFLRFFFCCLSIVDRVEAKNLIEIFQALCPGGRADRETFKLGLGKLEKCGLKNLDESPFADRLYDLLDTNQDGVVDLQEFVSGLSLLCKGSPEEKIECE